MNAPVSPPFSRLRDLDVFSVDATSAQITWRGTTGELIVAGQTIALDETAGAVTITGLDPSTTHSATLRSSAGESTIDITTLDPIGEATTKFATISDVHLGLRGFGVGKRITDSGNPSHPMRCALAAVDELQEWGAEVLLIKGDLTESGWIEEWELSRELFAAIDIPVLITGGNHDGFERAEVEPVEGMRIAGADYDPVQVLDLAGVRIVLVETSVRRSGIGRISPVADELVAAADTDVPVFVGMHHNLQHLPVPWFWPPGISSSDSGPVLDRLAATNPNLFMSSGHTHRNRRHGFGPDGRIVFTEVASTSDYPGVWAGYEVTPQAIRQTVHRIAEPSVIEWSEKARKAVGGVWPRWSQGRLHDRAVDLRLR